ncbi:hypothetical protein L1887_05877 [Cichorium endivia]|nr:hypothetical protein L1887_05877 [Cichorium endivia]
MVIKIKIGITNISQLSWNVYLLLKAVRDVHSVIGIRSKVVFLCSCSEEGEKWKCCLEGKMFSKAGSNVGRKCKADRV